MHNPVKVYLCGSENNGWALDTDLRLAAESLRQIPDNVQLTSLEEAHVVHSVWEEPLFKLDQKALDGKRVVCQVCNNFMRLHENPGMIRAADTVGLWLAMSREACRHLQELSYPYAYVPYSIDTSIFRPTDSDEIAFKKTVRRTHGIPESTFVISNFMRDSFGHDLTRPKDQKGVELLVEIGSWLKNLGVPVHFLLAGPRRHWLRGQLRALSIPFTFIGKEIAADDLPDNILSAEEIRTLYCASDLHLITSRWEGGPRSVLEAAATKTPIISTRVGIAPDILSDECLFDAIDEAVPKIVEHISSQNLNVWLDQHYYTIQKTYTPHSNAQLLRDIYQNIEETKPYSFNTKWVGEPDPQPTLKRKIFSAIGRFTGKQNKNGHLSVSLWHEFHKPPYGGGNQFMMALQGAMQERGVRVSLNRLAEDVDVHICNSCWFDYKRFLKRASRFPIRMIHRIDGPVTLYRGEGRDVDEKIFSLNRQLASATVFQSAYSFSRSYDLGFRAVSPVIIHNAVNSSIFSAEGRSEWDGQRKLRLITSAWSDNPRKGGALLKWLDEHLDWSRFEYTFVGRTKEQFAHIRHVEAVPSEELANLLKEHDIYVSASQHEPCSNALLEALSCGLPALYRNDGGNPELVSFGGLPFNNEADVLSQLDRLAGSYQRFKNLICVRSMDDIADRYIRLARQICSWQA